jgi:hypothetical protein
MELRMMIGAGKDETNDEIREKLAQKNKEEMKEDGIEFGKDNMKSGFLHWSSKLLGYPVWVSELARFLN